MPYAKTLTTQKASQKLGVGGVSVYKIDPWLLDLIYECPQLLQALKDIIQTNTLSPP